MSAVLASPFRQAEGPIPRLQPCLVFSFPASGGPSGSHLAGTREPAEDTGNRLQVLDIGRKYAGRRAQFLQTVAFPSHLVVHVKV